MTKENKELDQMIKGHAVQAEQESRMLTMLLDKYSQRKGKVFALKSEMGFTSAGTGQPLKIPSFVVTQSLDWVGKHVKMGVEMPFMQTHIDKEGMLVIDESIAEEVTQRRPDWTRMPAIAAYLAHDKRRKFGAILAILSPAWVDDPNNENWGPSEKEKRALKSSYHFEPLDSKGQIGLLDLDDSLIYALDGQHRVMGIRGIQELQEMGFLQIRKSQGTPTNTKILKTEFLEKFNLSISELQKMLNETITIELIPAVIAGESHREASQRVRSVFITINAYAKKTGKSETTLLDESDGFAIVARKAGTLHSLFKDNRVNWKGSNLPKRTLWYTTLETLKSMTRWYLTQVENELVEPWKPWFKNQVPVRPAEGDIESGRKSFFEFLDHMNALPVFQGLESGDDLDETRLFPVDFENIEAGKGHLLTRPVGQEILALAVGSLIREGHTIDEIFKKLAIFDEEGGFAQHEPSRVWYGVTYEMNKNKMNTRTNIERAADLLKYMVRGAKSEDRESLMEFVVKSRKVGEAWEPKWRDFNGDDIEYDPDDITDKKQLPQPIGSA